MDCMIFGEFTVKLHSSEWVCDSDYKRGFQLGLRRAYHGERFGHDGQMELIRQQGGPVAEGLADGLEGKPPHGLVGNEEYEAALDRAQARAMGGQVDTDTEARR
jgi:hypothetical protein